MRAGRLVDAGRAAGQRVAQLLDRVRARAYRVLDTVPPVRRTVDALVRIEVIDRSMAIGAQALLALVPLLVILGAFFPDVTDAALERFATVTGLGSGGEQVVKETADESGYGAAAAGVDVDQVRATTGVIGILIVLFSATSFSRALQRMYEKAWEQPAIGGVRARRRCLLWLFGWLVATQSMTFVGWLDDRTSELVLEPAFFGLRCVLLTLIWWWSMWYLLFGRVGWTRLLFPAALAGVAMGLYTSASSVVMPRYVVTSANQFGALGVVLAVATWLVGAAGVVVVTTVVGRAVSEDPLVRTIATRLVRDVLRVGSGGRG
jgi:membrane protein